MRIERLLIENLGPLERVELNLRPVTVLMGPNEQGKSFIIDALGVLRFGTCRGLKANENHALTRNGSKGWAVEALVAVNPEADSLALRRTRSAGPDTATLDGAMGDARVWRALLDGRQVLQMSPAERRSLVADLLARDTSDLLEIVRDKGASEAILKAVEEGDLRKAHRLAEEDRRAIDRVLKEKQTIVGAGAEDPEVPTKSGTKRISTIPLAVIDTALSGARANWTAAVNAKAQADATRRAREDAEAAASELAALGAAPSWGDADERRLGEVVQALGVNADASRKVSVEAQNLRADNERAGARLAKAGATCPSCGQVLSADAVAALRTTIDGNTDRLVALGKDLTRLAGESETLRKEAKDLEERRSKARADARLRERLQDRVKAGGEAQAAAEAADPAPMEAEVRRIEALRETRLRYDGRMEALQQAQSVVTRLTEQRAAAAEIEACVVPDRIDDEGAALEQINAACAEFAPAIMGGPWVRVNADWTVSYAALRVELASDSAQIRVGLVLALALSRLSGVKCVFADRLEALDDSTRARVVTLLGSLVEKGEVETAIVATVRKEPPAPGTVPDWLGRVWVEGGKAKAL